MATAKNITGKQFGRLTAISRAKNARGRTRWNCVCECGNKVIITTKSLSNGDTKSCGCYKVELATKQNTTHGLSKIHRKTMRLWSMMKDRCYNINNKSYHDYGGRGITVCEQWINSFASFYHDMGDRPTGKTLDRINNDGAYSPSNCKWSTYHEQGHNKRNNVFITHKGVTLTHCQWSNVLGGNDRLVSVRISRGWDDERAVTTPPNN